MAAIITIRIIAGMGMKRGLALIPLWDMEMRMTTTMAIAVTPRRMFLVLRTLLRVNAWSRS
jgi:hypothetical protein